MVAVQIQRHRIIEVQEHVGIVIVKNGDVRPQAFGDGYQRVAEGGPSGQVRDLDGALDAAAGINGSQPDRIVRRIVDGDSAVAVHHPQFTDPSVHDMTEQLHVPAHDLAGPQLEPLVVGIEKKRQMRQVFRTLDPVQIEGNLVNRVVDAGDVSTHKKLGIRQRFGGNRDPLVGHAALDDAVDVQILAADKNAVTGNHGRAVGKGGIDQVFGITVQGDIDAAGIGAVDQVFPVILDVAGNVPETVLVADIHIPSRPDLDGVGNDVHAFLDLNAAVATVDRHLTRQVENIAVHKKIRRPLAHPGGLGVEHGYLGCLVARGLNISEPGSFRQISPGDTRVVADPGAVEINIAALLDGNGHLAGA